jgi:hypothetical protein
MFVMNKNHRDENTKAHGDIGYVGERQRSVDSYKTKDGGSVDRMLTDDDFLPSNIETIRYAMKGGGAYGMDSSDMPFRPEAKQSGPTSGPMKSGSDNKPMKKMSREKMAMGGIGKVRKDQY